MAEWHGASAGYWHSWLAIDLVSEDDVSATLRFRGGMQAEGRGFAISSGITTRVGYTNDSYDGGPFSSSGGFSAAYGSNDWNTMVDVTSTFTKFHDARQVSGYSEVTNASGFRNGTSTAYGTWSVSARTSHAWSFDANGGAGAPAPVTKWVGEAGYMPTVEPTREGGWAFLGWSTDASAATAEYAAGAECATDADTTFHAVWRRTYVPPMVAVSRAHRTASTDSTAESPSGAALLAEFAWSVDTTVTAGNSVRSVTVAARASGGEWPSESAVPASGTGGTASWHMAADTGTSYEVRCTVTDSNGMASQATAVVGAAAIPIDVGLGGAAVGIGRAAPSSAGVALGSPLTLADPVQARAALGLGMQRLYYDYDAGWVVYASDYLVWVYAWGVATGSGSWDSTTCPYVLPEKYRPSLSHITAPVVTTNGSSWTGYLVVNSQGQIMVSNRGNAGSTDARYGVLIYPVGV